MIASLKGKIKRIGEKFVEIEVNGVGYLVWMKKRGVNEGDEIEVKTYVAVSENDINLYGFDSYEDLDLFKMLITVSGVGPKSAAMILSESKSSEVVRAISEAEVEFFKKIKGVGLKTAQRIIVDLKSKIGGLKEINLKDELPLIEDDLFLSLKQLGFDKKEIETVTKKLPKEIVVFEEKVSWCLQNIK